MGFLCYDFSRLIFGGASTWRGLFSEFYGTSRKKRSVLTARTMSLCRLEAFAPAPAMTHMLVHLSAARVRKSYLFEKASGISTALRNRTNISEERVQSDRSVANWKKNHIFIWDWNSLSTDPWHKLLITFVFWCSKICTDIDPCHAAVILSQEI